MIARPIRVESLASHVRFSCRRELQRSCLAVRILVQIVLTLLDLVTGIGMLAILFGLSVLIPGIAVSVRVHDLDKSGWLLLVSFIPIVGAIIILVWMAQAGTSGPNRFGPVRVTAA